MSVVRGTDDRFAIPYAMLSAAPPFATRPASHPWAASPNEHCSGAAALFAGPTSPSYMSATARHAALLLNADLSREAARAADARGGARPPTPSLSPVPGKSNCVRYAHDDTDTFAEFHAAQYTATLHPPMSKYSRDGTDQSVSDVRVCASTDSHTLLSVLVWVCLSGFCSGAGVRTIPGPHHEQGVTPANVAVTCHAALLMARALSHSFVLDETIRLPIASSSASAPSSAADLSHRRLHTTVAFCRVGCSIATLLAWLDAFDGEYLMSRRPSERLVHNVDDVLAEPAARLQRAGAPARFSFEVTAPMLANLKAYNNTGDWDAHNHQSVRDGKDKIDKELAKEVHQRGALVLHELAHHFMPCFLPVPLGLIPKGTEGDMRMIADSSFVPRSSAPVPPRDKHLPRSVNDAISKDSVTTCRYGTALLHIIYMMVNLRIMYGAVPIYFCLLDTAGAFRHARVHYAVMPLLTAWIFFSLYIFVGMSFGATWSPGEYSIVEELVSNTLETLTLASISQNQAALKFSEQFRQSNPDTDADRKATFRLIQGDVFNPGITFDEFCAILARCFVDDFIILCMDVCPDAFHLALTALLWAKLVWFSHVSLPFRPSFVAWKKLKPFSTCGKALGYMIDTNVMTIRVPEEKITALSRTISSWLSGSTALTRNDIESLLGSVRFAFIVLPSGAFLSIRLNEFLTAMTATPRRGRNHGAGPRTFPAPDGARPELEQMLYYMENDANAHYFTCHMERMLLRFPTHDCPSDASAYGCAGWCKQLRVGWHYVWPPEVVAFFEVTRSINLLEYFGVVMNVWFMHSLLRDSTAGIPCCYFWTDNSAAMAWTAAAHLASPRAAALSRILDAVLSHTPMHTRASHVKGVVNEVADGLSRRPPTWLPSDADLTNTLASRPVVAVPPQIDSLMTPPPQLVSLMLHALLASQSPPLPQLIPLTKLVSFGTSSAG
jgi:hypothetical protein